MRHRDPLQGTLAGSSVTLINPLNIPTVPGHGHDQRAANTASGTYDDSAGNSGNWSGWAG
jgi:hypothetical protein